MNRVYITQLKVVFFVALYLILVTVTPVAAETGSGEIQPLKGEQGTLELKRIFEILGLLDRSTGVETDEEVRGALKMFQRRHGIRDTGLLDEETIEALGGPSSKLGGVPHTVYEIQPSDTLSEIATHFDTSIPILIRLNPELTSAETLIPGSPLHVPLNVPIPRGFRPQRMQGCRSQFVGSYSSESRVQELDQIISSYVEELMAQGFSIQRGETPTAGITFRKGEAVAGQFSFSAQTSDGRAVFDLAILIEPEEVSGRLAAPTEC